MLTANGETRSDRTAQISASIPRPSGLPQWRIHLSTIHPRLDAVGPAGQAPCTMNSSEWIILVASLLGLAIGAWAVFLGFRRLRRALAARLGDSAMAGLLGAPRAMT